MRIKVDGEVYSLDALEEVTLKDVLSFDGQAADLRLGCTWEDIGRLAEKDSGDLTDREQLLLFGVTAWAAQRVAGVSVTLDQALDHPLNRYEVMRDPQDRQAGSRPPTKGRKAPAGKKAAKKQAPRKGSAAAADAAPSSTSAAQG